MFIYFTYLRLCSVRRILHIKLNIKLNWTYFWTDWFLKLCFCVFGCVWFMTIADQSSPWIESQRHMSRSLCFCVFGCVWVMTIADQSSPWIESQRHMSRSTRSVLPRSSIKDSLVFLIYRVGQKSDTSRTM